LIVPVEASSKTKVVSLWVVSRLGVVFLHWPNRPPLMWSVSRFRFLRQVGQISNF